MRVKSKYSRMSLREPLPKPFELDSLCSKSLRRHITPIWRTSAQDSHFQGLQWESFHQQWGLSSQSPWFSHWWLLAQSSWYCQECWNQIKWHLLALSLICSQLAALASSSLSLHPHPCLSHWLWFAQSPPQEAGKICLFQWLSPIYPQWVPKLKSQLSWVWQWSQGHTPATYPQ